MASRTWCSPFLSKQPRASLSRAGAALCGLCLHFDPEDLAHITGGAGGWLSPVPRGPAHCLSKALCPVLGTDGPGNLNLVSESNYLRTEDTVVNSGSGPEGGWGQACCWEGWFRTTRGPTARCPCLPRLLLLLPRGLRQVCPGLRLQRGLGQVQLLCLMSRRACPGCPQSNQDKPAFYRFSYNRT